RASKYASDATIKSIVERNLEKRHLTPKNGAKIRVAVDDHVITLSGTVPSLKLMRQAEEQGKHAGDGVLVENHLSVADTRKSDDQLAQEVSHAIRMYPRYDIFDWIEGTVHNGVVPRPVRFPNHIAKRTTLILAENPALSAAKTRCALHRSHLLTIRPATP